MTRKLAATMLAGCALLLPGCGGEEATEDNVVDSVPADAHPTLEVFYPAARPTASPFREQFELKERC